MILYSCIFGLPNFLRGFQFVKPTLALCVCNTGQPRCGTLCNRFWVEIGTFASLPVSNGLKFHLSASVNKLLGVVYSIKRQFSPQNKLESDAAL